MSLRNIRFRFLMFIPQKIQEISWSLLYLCHNYIGCCSILFTILLFHCFHHLWFDIRQRYIHKMRDKTQIVHIVYSPFFPKRRKSLCLEHRCILVQKVTGFLKCYWHHDLKRRQYRNGESNTNQFMIFVLCTQKQSFYERKIIYVHTRYTRRCLHQQEAVIFFHLIPGVEEKVLFLIERIIFGIIKFI